MSTWISDLIRPRRPTPPHRRRGVRRRAVLIAVLAILAACTPDADGVTRVKIKDGDLTIAAPLGYCVDRGALRDRPKAAFVLFGSCAALAPGPFSPAPHPLAVLTATASPNRPDAPPLAREFPRMAAYFDSSQGRRALSRSGRADSVTILRAFASDGAFILHLRDSSDFAGLRAAPDTWRAILDMGARSVTLSVIGLRNAPISAEDGERVLTQFINRIRAANQP